LNVSLIGGLVFADVAAAAAVTSYCPDYASDDSRRGPRPERGSVSLHRGGHDCWRRETAIPSITCDRRDNDPRHLSEASTVLRRLLCLFS
jgi:hypothetical protein